MVDVLERGPRYEVSWESWLGPTREAGTHVVGELARTDPRYVLERGPAKLGKSARTKKLGKLARTGL